MDPISIIVTALVLGAAAGLKPTAEQAVKDAYTGLKSLIQRKFTQVNIELVEDDPKSQSRQNVVKEDLVKVNADQDIDVIKAAQALIETVSKKEPDTAIAMGVNLADIKAASLRLRDIIATGTGVNIQRSEFVGDIDIQQVRAGGNDSSTNSTVAEHSSTAVSLTDVYAGHDVFVQVSQSIQNPNLPERRRRIALIKWLNLTADQMEKYINGLWRLGFGTDNLPEAEKIARRADLHRIENEKLEIVRFYTRLSQEVPDLFLQTSPQQFARDAFAEVFPAFRREFEACFEGLRRIERALDEGIYVPVADGTTMRVGFSIVFSSTDILEHFRILKLTVGAIIDLFPADEVEEAR